MKKNQKGFTLIELLVVMTIIAILAGLALVSYQGARRSARDGKRKADLEQIRSALEMCYADTNSYPASIYDSISCGGKTYLTTPKDSLDPARSYAYDLISASAYNLCASLEINPGDSYSDCGGDCTTGCNYQVKNP